MNCVFKLRAGWGCDLPPENSSIDCLAIIGIRRIKKAVISIFTNLGGLILIPSQILCPNAQKSKKIIAKANLSESLETFELKVENRTLRGMIYYPTNCDRTKCVVYNNMNAESVSHSFINDDGESVFSGNPKQLSEHYKCPVIMYDYRGTGLSSSRFFYSTPESIIEDGEAILKFASQKFNDEIYVAGASLGGAVATISLERCMSELKQTKIVLINHDSFSSINDYLHVKCPKIGKIVDQIFGPVLDAKHSMHKILQRQIPVHLGIQLDDPIIPLGSRMLDPLENLSISTEYLHVFLSYGKTHGQFIRYTLRGKGIDIEEAKWKIKLLQK